jgi:transposase
MRKIQEILRLHFEQKLGQRQIARSANVSQSTVHEYLARFQAAGLRWPLDKEWDEQRLEETLFAPGQTPSQPPRRTLPEFAKVRQELEQHRDGSVRQAPLFVSALGVSSYTYAEAVTDQQMANWLKVLTHSVGYIKKGSNPPSSVLSRAKVFAAA